MKKKLRLASLSLIILLALTGIGIAGGIQISRNTKRGEKQ